MQSRRLLGLVLVLLLGLGWRALGAPPKDDRFRDPRYQQAYDLVEAEAYPEARELAETMLAEDSQSYPAMLILGMVYHYGEGSLPRSRFYLERGLQTIESMWGRKIPRQGPWPVHAKLLRELIDTTGEIGDYRRELELIDDYNELYTPKLVAAKGWPLMKLGRTDEARKLMLKAADKAGSWERSSALNTLGNLEFEAGNMDKSYEYFWEICREHQDSHLVDPVFWSNAGEAARDMLRYDRAEELFLECSRRFASATYSDPWRFLAELYAAQGRLPEATSALKRMHGWRLSTEPHLAQQRWAECLTTSGLVLMACGYDRDALRVFERLHDHPDRNAAISTQASLVEGRTDYFYVESLYLASQRLREEFSYQAPWVALKTAATYTEYQTDMARVGSRAANQIAGGTGLEGFLCPYGPRSLDRPWLAPTAARLFGPGVVAATTRLLMADRAQRYPKEMPYYQAILGECLVAKGAWSEAETVLSQAREGLGETEVLLRARVEARLAQTLEAEGKTAQAVPILQHLLQVDPSVVRRCDLSLPLEIETDGSPAAQRAAALLGWSPRFRSGQGFRLTISGSGGLRGTLQSGDGTVLTEVSVTESDSTDATAREFCKELHNRAFAPLLDLGQTDIYSIDGSNNVQSAEDVKKMFFPGEEE